VHFVRFPAAIILEIPPSMAAARIPTIAITVSNSTSVKALDLPLTA